LIELFSDDHKVGGSELAPWPARLTSPPPRLADFGYSNEMFATDTVLSTNSILSFFLMITHYQSLAHNMLLFWCRNFGGRGLRVTGTF